MLEPPSCFAVDLVVKIGEPRANSRTSHGAVTPMQLVVDEGYQVFREKVKRIAEQKPDIEWGADAPIMLKPTNNATQAQYEELAADESSLRQQLLRLWGLASRRRTGQSAFKLELFIYVTRVGQNASLRRATQARVASAAAQIENHLAEQGATEAFGPASRAYWATSQARQPEGAPLITPTGTTFSQLQYIDEAQRRIDATVQADSNEAEFVTVHCHLNGGLIPLKLNLSDLREALGLPAYPLRPPFREALTVEPPSENMEDIDHNEQ